MKIKRLLWLLIISTTQPVFAQNKPDNHTTIIKVDTIDELRHYWSPAPERMAKIMPLAISSGDITSRHNDQIYITARFIVNENGDPEQFELISTVPEAAMQEEKFIKGRFLFDKYKKSPNNAHATPVLFEGVVRWYDPQIHPK
ncbi:hypothetical protein [Pseudoalteromonas tunicata]|jgi:hypothetical protein|uniref:Orphan protein n=1 Tax=Pseudoalteromonas tunicata D2 TaxID=87626 RepID=A4CDW5_9GAMM|nr:hypothetical protein [Pseudoalteromonas tunicata]ATC96350.1 hypothetical protein PTUN_a4136 [Pseudoalteromonas tunicata]AXT31848.1 hypothetical protein D1819_14175 [Pseudoalteromonas tunicata]EAR27157.1 hypothetical protein PTD2_05785 [Pseudoalteromonas tunicata D2]